MRHSRVRSAGWRLAGAAMLAASLVACSDPSGPGTIADGGDDPGTGNVGNVDPVVYTAAAALAQNIATHDVASDYSWSTSSIVAVTLNGASASVQGSGARVSGSTVTVTAPGTYRFSGTLSDGKVVVDTDDDGVVRLILSGADISCSSSAPIRIDNADRAMVVLADGTFNRLADDTSYVGLVDDEPNAALFSKADLTITGNGSLTVTGRYNDGIASKDGLIIAAGNITVSAVDDGIRGKDYLVVKGGNLNVRAGDDGLKSDNEDDARAGYIQLAGGTLAITAGGDAIEAESDLLVSGGQLTIATGGGSTRLVAADASAKGLKATTLLVVEDGTFAIDAADDAVHSNEYMSINGGRFDIATADDAFHADSALGVNGGRITVSRSYEGMESHALVIAGGENRIVSSDDALNAASGDAWPGGPRPGPGGGGGNNYLHVLGGYVAVTAAGDGLDVNGSVVMTGGTVLVHGPTRQDNGAIDYDGSFTIGGGFLLGVGSVGMAQAPGAGSSQYSLLLNSMSTRAAGTLIHIRTAAAVEIATFRPSKQYQSVAFSSPELKKGTTYQLYVGGSSSGTETDGLFTGGSYGGGSRAAEFTISSMQTRLTF